MTARSVAALLTDDPPTQEEIVRRIEGHPGVDPEAVLYGTEARLEGSNRSGLQRDSGALLWALDATIDEVWGSSGRNGSKEDNAPGALSEDMTAVRGLAASAGTLRGFRREGATLRLEATPLGGGRATILVSRLDPPARLYLDNVSLSSAKVRGRILEGLPDEFRAEARPHLEDLALDLLRTNDPSPTNLQGIAVEFEETEPWPDPVDGAALLDEIARSIRRYIVIPDEAATAATLWTLHTHALAAAEVSPILGISSPTKRCGKTTLQSVLRQLVRRPLPASNISGPALFRTIEKHEPTLLLDEADSYLTQNEEMRNLLNAGVRRDDAYVYRVVGDDHEPRRFSVYAPKTISLIGKLPGTLEDRSIIVRLKRKKKTERAERLRGRNAKEVFEPLRRKAGRWAADHMDELRDLVPAIPPSLNDRAADFWEPLLAIADAADGVWPECARRAAVALSGDQGLPDDSLSVQLLSDLRGILIVLEEQRVSSKGLTESLADLDERPWSTWSHGKPITQNQIARLLRPFDGVGSKTLRFSGGERVKGYSLESCQDAFDRYLPPLQTSEEGEAIP